MKEPKKLHYRVGRDGAVKRLKAHAKAAHDRDELEAIGETLLRETDRGAVILMGSMIEDVLENRIVSAMVPLNSDQRARLFGPDAPIGTSPRR